MQNQNLPALKMFLGLKDALQRLADGCTDTTAKMYKLKLT